MTLITSWFNKGIFKNTLKRFKWGSILYFAILFFFVPFPLLVMKDYYLDGIKAGVQIKMVLQDERLMLPIFMAAVVPTIVAVLVQNNVHSTKQGIFMHGLPVKRSCTYISQLAASAVLMAAPVLANAVILLLMSASGYGAIIPPITVLEWLAINLSMQFIMFAFAVFSGFLTGNAAAHIGINAFLHILLLLIAVVIALISSEFLYGFTDSSSFIADALVKYNPINWLFEKMLNNNAAIFTKTPFWGYIALACVLYVLGFILYKNRRIEACGDIAAFKHFRPILKYSVVAAAVATIFGLLCNSEMPAPAIFIFAAIVGAICYFAAEMLLSKTVRVFGKYKGYLGFIAFTAVFIGFFAFTSVFGYETKLPKKEDIAEATIYEGYHAHGYEPMLSDPDFLDECIEIHKELIKDIPISQKDYGWYQIKVKYILKNGKELSRRYDVEKSVGEAIGSRLYEFEEYKLKTTEYDKLNTENVTSVTLSVQAANGTSFVIYDDDARELTEAIGRDIRELSYDEIEAQSSKLKINISIGLPKRENDLLHYFDDTYYGEGANEYDYREFSVSANMNYKNTFAFLKEKGYYDRILSQMSEDMAILTLPVEIDDEGDVKYKEQSGYEGEFMINTEDCVPIASEDAQKVIDEMFNSPLDTDSSGSYYYIYTVSEFAPRLASMSARITGFKSDSLPEYLKKYIADA